MDIRPQDLPEVRAEAVRQREVMGPDAIARYHVGDRTFADRFSLTPREVAVRETSKLALADLFHVSAEMTELAVEAARSLPLFAADPEDFPAEVGMIFFSGGIPASWGGHAVKIHAATWQVLENAFAAFAFYIDVKSVLSLFRGDDLHKNLMQLQSIGAASDGLWFNDVTRLLLEFNDGVSDEQAAQLGERSGEVRGEHGERGVSFSGLQAVRASLLLMRQPLANVSELEPDRAARKRMRRLGEDPAAVRVIELRRPKGSSGEPGESGREYHHRWITRGHWRQQWYPARQVHRPVWIAPHVKGPEGAPLIGGEKVYAWKR